MPRGLIFAFIPLFFITNSMHAEGLQAGAATIDITPPIGYAMWGYGARHDAPSVGVRDPLKARALVLSAGKDRLALVSLDLGRSPTRSSMATIREKVAAAGIQQIFLVASHTHHGPVLELDAWPTPGTSYVRDLEKKLIEVILTANKDMKPARYGVASKTVELNRNRHSQRADKLTDPELLLLRVEDEKGKPIAHAVNFAAHPTMRDSKEMKFSADFPGVMAALVEKETAAPCLFLQGAAGDLSADGSKHPGPERYGEALAIEVLALAKTIRCSAPKETILQSAEEDFKFASRVDLGNPIVHAMYATAFFPGLIAFYEREYKDGIRPHLSVGLLDGRIGFVGVSGEFFCGHSRSLKRRARLDAVFFLGCCNDYQQYFPTIEAVAEGGYGASSLVAPVEVGAGERVIDRALILLYRLRGKLEE